MSKKEVWRSIEGYEGSYEVSDFGRVKSLRFGKERILKVCASKNGYFYVSFNLDGIKKSFTVHQLVAIAFLGHIPCGFERVVNHIDHNKQNNHVENLEIVTNRENTSVCRREGEHLYSSIYIGVSWSKKDKKWRSMIQVRGENVFLGLFSIELDAHHAYQKALKNIDNREYIEQFITDKNYTSKYKWIYFNVRSGKWVAQCKDNGKTKHVGVYDTEDEAYHFQQQYIKDNNLM